MKRSSYTFKRAMLAWEEDLQKLGLLEKHEVGAIPYEEFARRVGEAMQIYDDAREVREALHPGNGGR